VVALGGGSAMDSAKLAAATAADDFGCEHYMLARNPMPDPKAKMICLPTTSGTGSEATRVSVYTNAAEEKVWAWGPASTSLSILDPTLTVGLPATLHSGSVDALVHAIEAMTIRAPS
jgi:alcohol dehydrogenase class IV